MTREGDLRSALAALLGAREVEVAMLRAYADALATHYATESEGLRANADLLVGGTYDHSRDRRLTVRGVRDRIHAREHQLAWEASVNTTREARDAYDEAVAALSEEA